MQKRILLIGFFTVLLLGALLNVSAQVNVSQSSNNSGVDKAYQCLESKVEGKCSSLTLEQQIFSLLAIGACKSEVTSAALDGKCWPRGDCNLKTTAQAILALNKNGVTTNAAEEWLLAQNGTSTDLQWYLQIDSVNATNCTISYNGNNYRVLIGDDKKINTNAGSCLSLSSGSYWLRVASNCYDREFEVSCSNSFVTSLLYQKQNGQTIYVSPKTTSASPNGKNIEKIDARCFRKNNACNYEGSLWATLALDVRERSIDAFLPYLITYAEDNDRLIPNAFLYSLTGDAEYRNKVLQQQKGDFWDQSGDRLYDTALALLPLKYEDASEKTRAQNWLLKTQDANGCWQGDVRGTAFLLYAIWPRDPKIGIGGGSSITKDCEDSGFYCMSRASCTGKILNGYECGGISSCCDSPKQTQTCADLNGEICNSQEVCIGGRPDSTASDITGSQTCCVNGGVCEQKVVVEDSCETKGGVCRANGCQSGESDTADQCTFSGDSCCIKSSSSSSGSYWWIWVLVILILLVIVGFIFRDRIKLFIAQINRRSSAGAQASSSPRFFPPSGSSSFPSSTVRMGRPTPMIPSSLTQPRPARARVPEERDEVLRKLKEMGR